VPIDSDPDTPDRARETPAAPEWRGSPDGQPEPEARHSPDAQHRQEAPHPSEAQHTPEARGRREPSDEAEASEESDFRHRQIAEHVRYQHVVDAAYEAFEARQKWAEAVPGLRAAWEEHKERYPEQSRPAPRTQPDGGWEADGGRGLTPEQNAEATNACADLRDEADQVILPAVRRVEESSPDGRLEGLDHMLKGEDRLKEKIADVLFVEPRLTARQAADKVPDAVRFTLTYSAERYTDGVLADVDRLKAEGLELIKLKNLWAADQYKGINSQWRRPDTGTRLEMQFHTPESLEAKELTHEAYERLRRPESETSQSERDDLEDFQRRANGLLAIPPDVDSIKDFPEKKR
jgi:hypothetical protein